ncbi:MAG: putative sugar O-methyltransferase [Terriglobia bacterium]|uniref:putative sugar O-methyltransferase n=1 Tax=Mycobacterium sp. TaxID=1785 RepID=UPI003D6A2AC3
MIGHAVKPGLVVIWSGAARPGPNTDSRRNGAMMGRKTTSGDWSVVGGSISLGQRVEALTWLISFRARQINAARAHVGSWLRNRRGHSGRGIAPADRAALRATNPELQALRQRYAGVQDIIRTSPVWRPGHVAPEDLLHFRGDNAYVFQFRDNNTPEKYVLTYLYLKTIDALGLLDLLTEDGDYGVFTFPTGDTDKDGNKRFVSRDLLDSVCELLFLERALQISHRQGLKVLDIGAGYGRLAYRAVTALGNIETYFCIDAIPESTFISSYYLSRKGAAHTRVVAFDDQQDLVAGTIDLAINIHSFSECSIEAVDYWVSRCAELKIEYLFIVPNMSTDGEKAVRLINGIDFSPLLAKYGYQLCHVEPKYGNPEVQKYGVSPKWYYLFRAA